MKKLTAVASIAAALLVPAAPVFAGDGTGPIVHTYECPPGYIGRTVHVGDRGLLWGCYRLP